MWWPVRLGQAVGTLKQLVQHQQGCLRKIERRVRGVGRDRRDRVAEVEHRIAQAVVLAPEHQCHVLALARGRRRGVHRRLEAELVALDAVVSTRQPQHILSIVDGCLQRIELLRGVENVLRVVRNAADVPCVVVEGPHQAQLEETGVGHDPHHAADIDDVGCLYEDYGNTREPVRGLPGRVGSNEGQRLVTAADGVFSPAAHETRRTLVLRQTRLLKHAVPRATLPRAWSIRARVPAVDAMNRRRSSFTALGQPLTAARPPPGAQNNLAASWTSAAARVGPCFAGTTSAHGSSR